LFRVTQQLIENRIQHAFSGRQKGIIEIIATTTKHNIVILVKDDGIGMNSNVLDNAFDPFTTTTRGDDSLGFGLHIIFNTTTQTLGDTVEALPSNIDFSVQLTIPSEVRSG